MVPIRTVAQVAEMLGGRVEGDAAAEVVALSALTEARAGDLSFLSNPRYERLMGKAKATAVIVGDEWQGARRRSRAAPAYIRQPLWAGGPTWVRMSTSARTR